MGEKKKKKLTAVALGPAAVARHCVSSQQLLKQCPDCAGLLVCCPVKA